MARGCNVLVHEATAFAAIEAAVKRGITRGEPGALSDYMAHMKADHTSAGDASCRRSASPTMPGNAAKTFKGESVIGPDLMVV